MSQYRSTIQWRDFRGCLYLAHLASLDIELTVELVEDLLADYSPVVVAPAGNLWIEKSNEVFLLGRFVTANALGQCFAMTLDGVCTRFDEGLEVSSTSRVELACSILTIREPQKVEAGCIPFLEEGVS